MSQQLLLRAAQCNAAQRSAAQHSTAQGSTAQRVTAWHGMANMTRTLVYGRTAGKSAM